MAEVTPTIEDVAEHLSPHEQLDSSLHSLTDSGGLLEQARNERLLEGYDDLWGSPETEGHPATQGSMEQLNAAEYNGSLKLENGVYEGLFDFNNPDTKFSINASDYDKRIIAAASAVPEGFEKYGEVQKHLDLLRRTAVFTVQTPEGPKELSYAMWEEQGKPEATLASNADLLQEAPQDEPPAEPAGESIPSAETPEQNIDDFLSIHLQMNEPGFENITGANSEQFRLMKQALDKVFEGYDLKNLTPEQRSKIQFKLDQMFVGAFNRGQQSLPENVRTHLAVESEAAKKRQEDIRQNLRNEIDVANIDAMFEDRNSILGTPGRRQQFLEQVYVIKNNPAAYESYLEQARKLGFNIKEEKRKERGQFLVYWLAMLFMESLKATQSMAELPQQQQ